MDDVELVGGRLGLGGNASSLRRRAIFPELCRNDGHDRCGADQRLWH